jgi:O-antigen ligase
MTVALRPTITRLPALPPEAWLIAGLLGAVAFAVAALFVSPLACIFAAAASLAAGACFYEQRLLGPLLAVALPLEITKLAFPFLQTRSELGGGIGETSIVDAGRLVVALAFAIWLIRPGRARAAVVPTSPLTLPLALLFAVYACSTLWAFDPGGARTETIRLLFSLGGFALVPFFVRDRVSLRWTLLAFVAVAAALAVVGVYQQITGDFFWNEGLGRFGERRINTTFADPNHFARFLLEAIVVAMMLWAFVSRRLRYTMLAPAIALSMLTLVFTGSRGAWAVGVITLPAAVLAMPIAGRARLRVMGTGVVTIVVIGIAIAAISPFFTKRVETAKFGTEALGARPYLVEAGLDMFTDYPLTGVGAGGYQAAFEEDYFEHKDPKIKANVTASHTSAVTILAELGLIGALAVAFLVVRWASYIRSLAATRDVELRAVALGIGLMSAVIFLGSQTEGRFLEDPFLWFIAGLAVAIEAIGRASAGREPTTRSVAGTAPHPPALMAGARSSTSSRRGEGEPGPAT